MTSEQSKLLRSELKNTKKDIKQYIHNLLNRHVIIENGMFLNEKDSITEEFLYEKQIKYILETKSTGIKKNINKYTVSNYYYQLAKRFNEIALERNISRNELWQIVKNNILIKNMQKTELRVYKYIFRGEIIPSPMYVYNALNKYDDLPSYLSIVYLDSIITPELKEAYNHITKEQ